jgi:EAL domain-containing protein (putative c-di-GMP-specific phosphodiesterase class I)
MRQAKANGRDRYEFLDQDLRVEAERRLRLSSSIREGLHDDEFTPWFQPIVALATGDVVGHEALVRWIRSDGRPVEAWQFLPVAERGHLIGDIDLVVLHKTIEVLSGDPDSSRFIAVNVSAESLRRGDYDTQVLRALESWGVPPERLHLEVTETALLDITPNIRTSVDTLANAGLKWYVDDFGTGYSSISHLRDLPIAGLKLDQTFTAGIAAGDETCVRLADGLIGLADGLGLDTVAEGIETHVEERVLAGQGWSHGQGWLYGRPAPRRA